jgi:hypothetical protein
VLLKLPFLVTDAADVGPPCLVLLEDQELFREEPVVSVMLRGSCVYPVYTEKNASVTRQYTNVSSPS